MRKSAESPAGAAAADKQDDEELVVEEAHEVPDDEPDEDAKEMSKGVKSPASERSDIDDDEQFDRESNDESDEDAKGMRVGAMLAVVKAGTPSRRSRTGPGAAPVAADPIGMLRSDPQ